LFAAILYNVTFVTFLGFQTSHVITAHQSGSPDMPPYHPEMIYSESPSSVGLIPGF